MSTPKSAAEASEGGGETGAPSSSSSSTPGGPHNVVGDPRDSARKEARKARSFTHLEYGNRSMDLTSIGAEFLASKRELVQVLAGGGSPASSPRGSPPPSFRGGSIVVGSGDGGGGASRDARRAVDDLGMGRALGTTGSASPSDPPRPKDPPPPPPADDVRKVRASAAPGGSFRGSHAQRNIERARQLLGRSNSGALSGRDSAPMRAWSDAPSMGQAGRQRQHRDVEKSKGDGGGRGSYWDGIRSTIGLGRRRAEEEESAWEREREARAIIAAIPGSPDGSDDRQQRRNLAPKRRYSKDALTAAIDDHNDSTYDYAMDYGRDDSEGLAGRVRAAASSFCAESLADCGERCRQCRRSFHGRYSPICMVLVSLAVAALTVAPILTGRAKDAEARGRSYYQLTDAERYVVIRRRILDADVSLPADLPDASSDGDDGTPQYRALDWISAKDPARLDPDDPALLQRYALSVFFHSTGGGQWQALSSLEEERRNATAAEGDDDDDGSVPIWGRSRNWLGGGSVCAWAGVSCRVRSGRTFAEEESLTVRHEDGIDGANDLVRELNLTTNGLIGSIPREIVALRHLRILDLSYNDMGGTLPEQVSELFQLVSLRLDGNRGFEGTIPPAIHQLSHLEELHLPQNKFGGKVPPGIGNSTKLKSLVLNDNSFTGPIPDSIGVLWHLAELRLHNNSLTGSIPPAVGRLENLVELHLCDNQLTGTIPPSVPSARYLERIDLCHNGLNGTVPDAFDELSDLTVVRLCDNKLSGPIPPSLGSLPRAITIRLDGNRLTGTVPAALGGLGRLRSLELGDNDLTGTVPQGVCALRRGGSLAVLSVDCRGDGAPVECGCCEECPE